MEYGNNNNNYNDYNSNHAYLENLNNYQTNNYNNLKPIENKKLLLKYSGNNDAPQKNYLKRIIYQRKINMKLDLMKLKKILQKKPYPL